MVTLSAMIQEYVTDQILFAMDIPPVDMELMNKIVVKLAMYMCIHTYVLFTYHIYIRIICILTCMFFACVCAFTYT